MNDNLRMVFGAPGCGKTTYLIHLLSGILDNYPPQRVAFVSFTKKGSYEGRDRLIERLGLKEKDLPYFRTIHSIAFRELGMSRDDMISKAHYKEFSKAMGMHFVGYYTEEFINNDDRYLFQVSLEKNNPRMAKALSYQMESQMDLTSVRKNYEAYKEQRAVIDYDDLLVNYVKKGTGVDVDVAIIDEAQDLTTLQWEFCRVAFGHCKEVYIAGDDDQAIYQWNGADVAYFLGLTKTAVDVKVLSHSYRLKPDILRAAKTLSGRISQRVEKEFTPSIGEGRVLYYNDISEIALNSEESYYLLARNNSFLREYRERLMMLGIPFYFKGQFSVDMALYNAIIRYEGYRKKEQFERIRQDSYLVSRMRRDVQGYGPWFDKLKVDQEEEMYLRKIFKNGADVSDSKIHVSTIHGVKGGEADNVVLRLDITRSIHNALTKLQESRDSELRVLYVAFTRAKKNLHIVHETSRYGYPSDVVSARSLEVSV